MGPAALLILAAVARGADVDLLHAEVAAARGLPFLEPVEVREKGRNELRAELLAEIDELLPRREARDAARALEAIGALPPGFDLRGAWREILGAQLAGYYDDETEELYVVVDPDLGPDPAVARHELVHALQDQHFDLFALTRRELEDQDVALAVRCLIEGDATFAAEPELRSPDDLVVYQGPEAPGLLGPHPRFLTEPLLFPYVAGLLFVEALHRHGGQAAVDAAYRRPPLSSEQVLHPERYLAGDTPQRVLLPRPRLGPGWRVLGQDTLGELGLRILLEEQIGDPGRAAAGWDGDRLTVLEHRSGALAFAWLSVWDDASEAAQLERAARQWVGRLRPGVATGDPVFTLRQGDAVHRVERRGERVLVLVGIPSRRLERVVERLWSRSTTLDALTLDAWAPPPSGT